MCRSASQSTMPVECLPIKEGHYEMKVFGHIAQITSGLELLNAKVFEPWQRAAIQHSIYRSRVHEEPALA